MSRPNHSGILPRYAALILPLLIFLAGCALSPPGPVLTGAEIQATLAAGRGEPAEEPSSLPKPSPITSV